MQDRFNTIAGWVLFSGIIALGLSIGSGMYFEADKIHPPHKAGYPVAGAVEEGAAEEGPPLATLLATGDAAAGEKIFAKCTSCHTANQGGAAGIGPNLFGVLGKPVGKHAAGFAYSADLAGHGGDWTYELMDQWLKSPKALVPGTKMSFAGLSNPQDRANVMLFLMANGGGPPLPAPPAETAAGGGDEAAAEAAGDPSAAAGPATAPGADAAGAAAQPAPANANAATAN